MKNLGYKTIFGREYTHEEALKKDIISGLMDIICDENDISEKAFTKYDEVKSKLVKIINSHFPNIFKESDVLYQSGHRLRYIYEHMYQKHKDLLYNIATDSITTDSKTIDSITENAQIIKYTSFSIKR